MHDYDSKTGIIFYSQVALNGAACWNTNTEFSPKNHVLLDQSESKMIYPVDLNVSSIGGNLVQEKLKHLNFPC